jgi:hypothetical protein
MMIDVIGVRQLGGFRLEIEFSDGAIGVRDFRSIIYDWDPIALHDKMKLAGLLRRIDAAE